MKMMKVMLAGLLMAAIATPAMAEFKLNGYFRTQMYSLERKDTIFENGGVAQNVADAAAAINNGQPFSVGSKNGNSQQMVDQRMRLRAQYSLNDNVSIVYFGEVDYLWGEGQFATSRQSGGGLGADTVNMETKNAFLNVKFDNTNITLGTQGLKDDYLGLVFFHDMTGVSATQKYGSTSVTAAYSKWSEGARTEWDDRDFYVLAAKQKLGDAATFGASLYYEDDNGAADAEIFYLGVNGDFKAGPVDMNAFMIYQTGEFQAADVDHDALAFSVKGTFKLDNGSISARYLFISDDDDANDSGAWRGDIGAYALAGEGMMIFFYDPYYMNVGAENYALADAATQGYGLHALTVAASFNLPDSMYAKCGAGFFMAASDEADDSGLEADGKFMGYEVNARVGKKFFEKVDVSLNAAYAGFGKFYNDTIVTYDPVTANLATKDPDGIYKLYAMVNVPF